MFLIARSYLHDRIMPRFNAYFPGVRTSQASSTVLFSGLGLCAQKFLQILRNF